MTWICKRCHTCYTPTSSDENGKAASVVRWMIAGAILLAGVLCWALFESGWVGLLFLGSISFVFGGFAISASCQEPESLTDCPGCGATDPIPAETPLGRQILESHPAKPKQLRGIQPSDG